MGLPASVAGVVLATGHEGLMVTDANLQRVHCDAGVMAQAQAQATTTQGWMVLLMPLLQQSRQPRCDLHPLQHLKLHQASQTLLCLGAAAAKRQAVRPLLCPHAALVLLRPQFHAFDLMATLTFQHVVLSGKGAMAQGTTPTTGTRLEMS